jgi:hypothetical protein
VKHATRRSHLGYKRWRRWGRDNAQHGKADRHGGATPVSPLRRCEAWEGKQATPESSSPPREVPSALLGGGEAAESEINGAGARLGFQARAAQGFGR